MTRPSFIATKGQRRTSRIDTTDIMRHYRNILRGSSRWEGLPDGIPPGFIEDTALWFSPGFALKKVRGWGIGGFPVNPVTLDIYGRPVSWLPSIINGVTAYRESDDVYRESDTPVLWIGTSLEDQIKPYAQLMAQCLTTLGQNLTALSQPVLISGQPSGQAGDNIGALLLQSDLMDGSMYIPTVTGQGVPLEVLDLHAVDNTQNLVSTLNAMDARILEILRGSNGIEKSSGITTAETETGERGLEYNLSGYDALCDEWCDRVNDKLGLSISHRRVEPPKPELMESPGEQEDDDDDGEA